MSSAILWCVAALLGIMVIAVAAQRRREVSAVVYGGCGVASLIMLGVSAVYLLGGAATPSITILPLGLPWIGARFRVDALSAFFLVVVNLGAFAASIYGLGHGRHEAHRGRILPFYPAFLAGMNLVVLADDAFSFLVAWEFMSLTSWALVVAHHRVAANLRAGYIYLIMASFGAVCLLLAFGVLAGPAGSYGFETMRAHAPSPGLATLVLVLAIFGAGSKAGLVPLHVWLPLAHPAAPSHVSALMSGVMTKVAVYAFVRIVFDLAGPPVWWWSLLVLALGGASAALGVLYALMQHDLKRLLAYHTVENIGIIFIGLGLALAFKAEHMPLAAALAMTAALFHVFNHSLFKSLLFFGAGAVLVATGERDMEKMGGLIRRMPQTAFAFLVGCVAISALPPLNGFVSEWLTFQAILLSPRMQVSALQLMVPAVGTLLALSAALAAACFVKVFGICFLGRPRSKQAEEAVEADRFSRAVMFGLAALCLLAGVLPGFVIDALAPVAQALTAGRLPAQAAQSWFAIVPIAEARSSYSGLLVFGFIAFSALTAASVIHRFASRASRRAPAWDCGFPVASPITQYTAGSFAQPIRRVFGTVVFSARVDVDMPPPGDMRPARFKLHLRDPIWDSLYAPIAAVVNAAATRFNALQFLTIRAYMTLVFLALVSLLLVLAIWL